MELFVIFRHSRQSLHMPVKTELMVYKQKGIEMI